MTKKKVMVNIRIKMDRFIKDSFTKIKDKDLEILFSKIIHHIKDNGRMSFIMIMKDNIITQMDVII